MVVALVGFVAAIAGALAGAWFTSHEQRRQWRDNLRLEAYLDVIGAWRKFMFRGGEIGSPKQMKDHDQLVLQMRDALEVYRTAYNKVRLVGPAEVALANENLHHYCSYTLFTWFEKQSEPQSDNDPTIIEARELFETFLGRVQQALGISAPDGRIDAIVRIMRSRRSL